MFGIFSQSASADAAETSIEGVSTVEGAKVDQDASLSSAEDEQQSEDDEREGEDDEREGDDEEDEEDDEDGVDDEDEDPVLLQEDIDSLFTDVDQDGDGKISLADLGADMKKARDEELAGAEIDDKEMAALLEVHDAELEALKVAFDLADTDKDGALSKDEVMNNENIQDHIWMEDEDEDEDEDSDEDEDEDEEDAEDDAENEDDSGDDNSDENLNQGTDDVLEGEAKDVTGSDAVEPASQES